MLMWLQVRSGPLGNLFRPDTFFTGESGAGNNWAKGCELRDFSDTELLFHAYFYREAVYTEGVWHKI